MRQIFAHAKIVFEFIPTNGGICSSDTSAFYFIEGGICSSDTNPIYFIDGGICSSDTNAICFIEKEGSVF